MWVALEEWKGGHARAQGRGHLADWFAFVTANSCQLNNKMFELQFDSAARRLARDTYSHEATENELTFALDPTGQYTPLRPSARLQSRESRATAPPRRVISHM